MWGCLRGASAPLLIKERDTRGESKRGEASLIYPFPLPFSKGIKRGEAPLKNYLPSPLGKGRGIKGEGLLPISSLRT